MQTANKDGGFEISGKENPTTRKAKAYCLPRNKRNGKPSTSNLKHDGIQTGPMNERVPPQDQREDR